MIRTLALALLLSGCTGSSAVAADAPPSQAPPGFWDHWGDGKAELDGYDLVQPRYGHTYTGTVVLVFVTETFTAAQRVKSDGAHDDEFPVLKLNSVRHFQTGIYDYDILTSTFVPLDGRLTLGLPTKETFGSQEWCGNVFDELIVDPGHLERTWHSYFDGEADGTATHDAPAGGVFADAMPALARGLAGSLVAPGTQREVPWYPRIVDTRFAHRSPAWTTATLSRSADTAPVTVPAGTFDCTKFTAKVADGTTFTWQVEAAAPHRLVEWTISTGEKGTLRGSDRLAYWKLHDPGQRTHLADIGMPVPRPVPPPSATGAASAGAGR